MNRFYCEKEAEIVQALRVGVLDSELEKHARSCAICSDAASVSEFLIGGTATAPMLPDSDFLWWKAQLASKEKAVERATRSIVLVRRAAYMGVGAAAMWLVLSRGNLSSIVDALSKHDIWSTGALSQTALLMGVSTLVFAVLGSLYLARPEK